jgi:2-hydroxy-6-oxonona-2,4-dienedioate hydrolase
VLDTILYRGAPRRLDSRRREVEGRRVYERFGGAAGPTVVFVHGIGVSGRYLLPTAARLADRCRVFVPDLPGFGRSSRLGRRLTVRALSDALDGWLTAVALERADVVVANSFGCQLALDLAARRPQRVGRLVLVGPTVDAAARSLTRQAVRLALDATREPLALDFLQAFDYCVHVGKSGVSGFVEMVRDRPEDRLAGVTAPTLVVRGERDPIVSHAWAERVAGGVQNGRLVEVHGVPHVVNYAAPDALAQLVREFAAGG